MTVLLSTITPLRWEDNKLLVLDQRFLPEEELWVECDSIDQVADAIESMIIRGAPAIGVIAAFGMAFYMRDVWNSQEGIGMGTLQAGAERLNKTRPTAVNLMWATNEMCRWFDRWADDASKHGLSDLGYDAITKANHLWVEDVDKCKTLSEHGAGLICAKNIKNIMTHCNAGALATGGYGTALGVIRSMWAESPQFMVWANETRPYLQGARLTSYELNRDGIPVTVLPDSAAHQLIMSGKIDAIVVGADRIAANGDVANKIGTLGLALTAKQFGVPFYVAAPENTIDRSIASGEQIVIEQRLADELRWCMGKRIIPDAVSVYNPGFDVTPAGYIDAIVTENGIHLPHQL